MRETDSWFNPQDSAQDYHDRPDSQPQGRGEIPGQTDGGAYWRVSAQITNYFETQRPQLMINLGPDLQSILHGRDGRAGQLLDDYERVLAAESKSRRDKHEQINEALILRLGELGSGQDPIRITEKELLASVWYQEQSGNFANDAEFHRTRLEIAKLRLIACSDFGADSFFDNQASTIAQIAKDECLEAVNWAYAQEMATCHRHCWVAAGEDPASEKRQNALLGINLIRSSQTRVGLADTTQNTNNHALFWTAVHQLAELRRVWDQTIDPPTFAGQWLAGLRDEMDSWVVEMDNNCHKNRYQIHLVASVG